MRKLFLILLLLCSSSSFSQKVNPWSVEIGASHYDYSLIDNPYNNTNGFNYEFYILPSKNFSFLKLTTGLMYSTKNIKHYRSTNNLYKVNYDVDYIKLPIMASFGYSYKKMKFSIFGGFILDHILNYRLTLNYNYGESEYQDYKFKDYNMSVRGGIIFSTEISKNLSLNIKPFIDYKVDPDDIDYIYNPKFGAKSYFEYYYSEFPNGDDPYFGDEKGGLLSYGLSIGLEYTFKKDK